MDENDDEEASDEDVVCEEGEVEEEEEEEAERDECVDEEGGDAEEFKELFTPEEPFAPEESKAEPKPGDGAPEPKQSKQVRALNVQPKYICSLGN